MGCPLLRVVSLFSLLHATRSCTTILAGKDATIDGSVMVTHSNDGEGSIDPRLVHIPARDHAAVSKRPIYYAVEELPRYVGRARGAPAYYPRANQSEFEPIGFIPEAAHTFSYYEETYGAMNEKQVGIGESTCSGVFGTKAAGHGGRALMSIDTLSQIAMERASSSREAVQLMGSLAEKYGFYGAGSFEGTAESLLVSDPREGFIFHILPDPTGESAIWAAQRVPDDHIAVVPNVFIIREVNFTDSANFLGSASVHSVALSKGWWRPSDGLIDFTRVYSDGEYAHKYYSGRRVWGVYRLLAPSLALKPNYGEWRVSRPYPVSAPPDQKVDVASIAAAMRSYYEGSEFDQTVGLAAGPWGTPDHAAGGSAGGKVKGNWERTIGLFRTSDSYIVQSRSWLPDSVGGVLWWGAHAAPYTLYVPFAAGMERLPACTLGTPAALDRSTLFWGVRYLYNYAQLKRDKMIGAINALQDSFHAKALQLQVEMDLKPANASSADGIYAAYAAQADAAVSAMASTADGLFFKYADGYVTEVTPGGGVKVTADDYPDWWLKAVGYQHGPPPVPKEPPRPHADSVEAAAA